jgi:hypothetical protein
MLAVAGTARHPRRPARAWLRAHALRGAGGGGAVDRADPERDRQASRHQHGDGAQPAQVDFVKTGTKRQPELIAVLARLLPFVGGQAGEETGEEAE